MNLLAHYLKQIRSLSPSARKRWGKPSRKSVIKREAKRIVLKQWRDSLAIDNPS
jgi:hypothetical protein